MITPQTWALELLGRTLGNWRLRRLIGAGAFGAVFEAENVLMGRRAAVKVLAPMHSPSPEMQRRFLDEARATVRIEHEHVVTIFDVGAVESLLYIVMEYLDGPTLTEVMRKGAFDTVHAARIGTQIAAALGAAHRANIVHRDLKPDNVVLVRRAEHSEFAKVLDFGVAKLLDEVCNTVVGTIIGTPGYMAPEQWRSEPDLDGRADVYALGMILYECATGAPAFVARSQLEWLGAHLFQPVPDPSRHGVDAGLSALIKRMCRKERAERPESMDEVEAALRVLVGRARCMARTVLIEPVAVPALAQPDSGVFPASTALAMVEPKDACESLHARTTQRLAVRDLLALIQSAPEAEPTPETSGLPPAALAGSGASAGALFRSAATERIPTSASPPAAPLSLANSLNREAVGSLVSLSGEIARQEPAGQRARSAWGSFLWSFSGALFVGGVLLTGRSWVGAKSKFGVPAPLAVGTTVHAPAPSAPTASPVPPAVPSPPIVAPRPLAVPPRPPVKRPRSQRSDQSGLAEAALDVAHLDYVAGRYAFAIAAARQAIQAGARAAAWRVLGASACRLGALAQAAEAWDHLDGGDRGALRTICDRAGTRIP